MLLSTGGGIVESAENRARLRERCYVMWIDPPFEVLRRRLQASDLSQRPMFDGDWSRLRELLDRRRPLYAATAHSRIAIPIVNAARTARQLAREVQIHLESP
jgi:shikimate kinase